MSLTPRLSMYTCNVLSRVLHRLYLEQLLSLDTSINDVVPNAKIPEDIDIAAPSRKGKETPYHGLIQVLVELIGWTLVELDQLIDAPLNFDFATSHTIFACIEAIRPKNLKSWTCGLHETDICRFFLILLRFVQHYFTQILPANLSPLIRHCRTMAPFRSSWKALYDRL